jgi:hypothetical protein
MINFYENNMKISYLMVKSVDCLHFLKISLRYAVVLLHMKTKIVLYDVYCDVTYPEYLLVRNRYYKNPTSFKCFKIIVFWGICLSHCFLDNNNRSRVVLAASRGPGQSSALGPRTTQPLIGIKQ